MNIVGVNIKDHVLNPVGEVFAAIVDPEKLSGFFISSSSGPLKEGETVEWVFADVGAKLSVEVEEIQEERKIVFDWSASGVKTRVTIALEACDPNMTLVRIRESGWPMNQEGVSRALQQTQGWTDFLCCMKAFLQHRINLRLGRSK